MKACKFLLIIIASILLNYHAIYATETSPQSGQTTEKETSSQLGVPLTNIASISDECGLTTSGGVKCWGKYAWNASSLVVDIPTLDQGVQALSHGSSGDVRCALLVSGRVECWDKTFGSPSTTVELSGFAGKVTALAAGGPVCALLDDGKVQCIGSNEYGQLGNGNTEPVNAPATALNLSEGAIAIANSNFHTCAITTQQKVKCWGHNSYGQLGDGTTVFSRTTPALVVGLTNNIAQIAVSVFYSCALTLDGGVKCWGNNAVGQLGNGTVEDRNIPGDVVGLESNVKSVAVGYDHTCALLKNGSVQCWGANYHGQLGDGTNVLTRIVPVTVTNLAGIVVELSAGNGFTCARLQSQQVQCWGDGVNNSKMTQQFYSVPTPLATITQSVQSLFAASTYQTGFHQTCWLSDSNQIFCQEIRLKSLLADSEPIQQFAKGLQHICVLTAQGAVRCKGGNSYGQLGNGETNAISETTELETVIGLNSNVTQLVADNFSNCVIQSGDAKCWGLTGQFGFTFNPITLPTTILGLPNPLSQITLGLAHLCTLADDHSVYCWGANDYELFSGVAGYYSTYRKFLDITPKIIKGTENLLVSIDTGSAHTCGVTIQGGVKCWGRNDLGQLGVSGIISSASAIDVVGLSNVQKVVAGAKHTCALLKSGGVKCWGANFGGQLGDGTTDQRNIPTDVLGLNANVLDIDAGEDFTCVILQDRSVRCFGATNRGQINSTMIFDQPTTIITELLPHLSTTHQEGKVGSVFTINGIHFPPNQLLPIFINGTPFGAAQTTATGELIFFVDTQELAVGSFKIGVGSGAIDTLFFKLTGDGTVQLAQGGGTTVIVPTQIHFQYMPVVGIE